MNQFVVPVAEAWMDDAKCGRLPWDGLNTEVKVEVCGRCPVRDECSEFADRQEGLRRSVDLHDVYGAETPAARARRRRKTAGETLRVRRTYEATCKHHGTHDDFYVRKNGVARCRACSRNYQKKRKELA